MLSFVDRECRMLKLERRTGPLGDPASNRRGTSAKTPFRFDIAHSLELKKFLQQIILLVACQSIGDLASVIPSRRPVLLRQ